MMDNDLARTDKDRDAKPRPTAFIYGGVTFAVVVLVLVAYSYISRPKVSADYITKFDAVTALCQKMSNDSDATSKQLVVVTQSFESAKDYGSAAQTISQNLTSINNLATEVNSLNSNISDFNAAAEKVSDPTVRSDSLQVISLWEQSNSSFLGLLDYETQYLSLIEKYYKDMSLGLKATTSIDTQAATISGGIKTETDNMSSLGTSIEAAYSRLSGDVNAQLQVFTVTDQ
jgi:hypothetical protein